MFDSLLGGATIYSNTGNFTIAGTDRITAVFLPTPQNQAYYPYNPSDGEKLWAVLSSADGTQIAQFDLWAQQRPAPYWVVDDAWVKNLATGEGIETKQVPLQPGNYVVDFFLPTGRFYTFPFSVTKLDSADPFNPQSYWFMDGPWRDWGCFNYADANPERPLSWVIYLRNMGRDARVSVPIQVTVADAGGNVVCTSRSGVTWDLMREWKRHEFEMVRPGEMIMSAGDLLSRDVSYTLRMTVNGESYGTWPFQVANGQFQYAGRTVRGAVEPLQFIEGGTHQWWYVRQESGQAPAAPAAPGGAQGAAPTEAPATAAAAEAPAAPAATTPTGAPEVIPGATRITINGNTMVPLRSVFEWLGAEVKWIPQALTIIATRGDDVVLMRTDSDEATVNMRPVPLPQRPVQQNGVTYVPLRFSAEAFGATVAVDAAGTISITDGTRVGIIR